MKNILKKILIPNKLIITEIYLKENFVTCKCKIYVIAIYFIEICLQKIIRLLWISDDFIFRKNNVNYVL